MKLTNDELDAILLAGHLKMAEPYKENQSYNKSRHILTECTICGVQAHYTLNYIMEKSPKEPVCRIHYWRKWFEEGNKLSPMRLILDKVLSEDPVMDEKRASELAEANDYELLDLFPGEFPKEELLRVKCKICGRISIEPVDDIGWKCSCTRVTPHLSGRRKPAAVPLRDSGLECVSWWDHDRNDEDLFATVKTNSKSIVNWKCPVCGKGIENSVDRMSQFCRCPFCEREAAEARAQKWARYEEAYASEIPELVAAWDDETHSPDAIKILDRTYIKFRCEHGHHPRMLPHSFLERGCPTCRKKQEEIAAREGEPIFMSQTFPELAQEWNYERNKESLSPDNVKDTSTRNVWWKCPQCGHEWQAPVYQRTRNYGQECPACRKKLNSFAWQYPTLASEWSPANPVSPWTIYPGTQLRFTPEWICRNDYEHIWKTGIPARVRGGGCPQCEDHRKSRIALEYFSAAKEVFETARCEVPLYDESFSHNPWNVDILVYEGNGKIAVEYDGSYWHRDKADVDARKTTDLLNAGYWVVRLREDDLPPLGITNAHYAEIPVSSAKPDIAQTILELKQLSHQWRKPG